MEINTELTQEEKDIMLALFNYCFTHNQITPQMVQFLIKKCFEKDKQIAELTQTIADLTKRTENLENKVLKKAGRQKQLFMVNGQELTDEYLMQLINEGYYDSISQLEKDVGAGKNQLRNRYNKAMKNLQFERQVKRNGNR